MLAVASNALDGDYNFDGAVNAADYVVYRKGLPTAGSDLWCLNFGAAFGGVGGSGASGQFVVAGLLPAESLSVAGAKRLADVSHGIGRVFSAIADVPRRLNTPTCIH